MTIMLCKPDPIHRGCVVCGVPCFVGECQCAGELHPSFAPPPDHGPGTELKKLLAAWPFYITSTESCPCNARAGEMNARGVEWCEENTETIVGWLREQAAERGLPFFDAAGRILVRRAIKLAKKRKSDKSP